MNKKFSISYQVYPMNVGMRLHRLIITNSSIKLGKHQTRFGFWKLLKSPKLVGTIMLPLLVYTIFDLLHKVKEHSLNERGAIVAYAMVAVFVCIIFWVKNSPSEKIELNEGELREIFFSDIRKVNLKRIKFLSDKYIEIHLNSGEAIKFFAADQLNSSDENTQQIFDSLSSLIKS